MIEKFNFKENDEVYEVGNTLDFLITKMLNKEFENKDAELNSDIEVTVEIRKKTERSGADD